MKTGLYLNCPCGVGVSLCCEGEGFFCQCGRGYVRNGDAIICNQDPQPTPKPRPFRVGDRVRAKWEPDADEAEVTLVADDGVVSAMSKGGMLFMGRHAEYTLIKPAPDKAEAGEAHGTGERETAMTPSKVTGAESCRDNIAVVPPAKATCATQYCGGHGHPVSWCKEHGWPEGSREMGSDNDGQGPTVAYTRIQDRIEWVAMEKPTPPPLYKCTAGPKPKWWQPW